MTASSPQTQHIFAVNRLYVEGQATSKVVVNKSNRGGSEKEARHYGRLISRKGNPSEYYWKFVGVLNSTVADLPRMTEIGGLDEERILARSGVDLRSYV